MITINELLRKYQKIEALFLTPEIAEFKRLLEKFKAEQNYMIRSLQDMQAVGHNTHDSVQLLINIIGKE